MNCFCGGKLVPFEHEIFLTQEDGAYQKSFSDRYGKCIECGTVRFCGGAEEYDKYPPTKPSYGAKDYDHDRCLSIKRCDDYGIFAGSDFTILDIGSGSGAFVDECRLRGNKAYGCELTSYHYSKQDSFIYKKDFLSIGFPTDYFSIITCHDVLEHIVDIRAFVREAFRILQQGGEFFLDYPRFFSSFGEHHWKPEHIWCMTEEVVIKLLSDEGFCIGKAYHPIESKTVFVCSKPEQQRPTILVPPGIGDSYWSIVKMESFLKENSLGIPDVTVVCPRSKKHNGHERAFPFLQLFPFINCTWSVIDGQDRKSKQIWQEAYARPGRTVFKNVLGYDYFLSYNGHLRVGKQLEEADNLLCNWHPKMFVSLEQEHFKQFCLNTYGPYVVFYFVFQGTYRYWTADFPVERIKDFVMQFTEKTGLRPVFAGGRWDAEEPILSSLVSSIPGAVDLLGKTTVRQLFGLLTGSSLVVGFPSGLTIMSAVLGAKTLCIWNTYYNKDFFWHAVPPDTRRKNYFVEYTSGLTKERLFSHSLAILNNTPFETPVTVPPTINKKITTSKEKQKKISTPPTLTTNLDFSIFCVLKSGGDYTVDNVVVLRNMVKRGIRKDVSFYVLTDLLDVPELGDCRIIPLKDNLPGWWSKIELFRPDICEADRIIYFDLDTVITGSIDGLANLPSGFFYGLQPWNPKNRANGMVASGMMVWEPKKYQFIYKDFNYIMVDKYQGDQQYITDSLEKHGYKWRPIQNDFSGIYSFKRNCRNGLPKDAKIVCFHGKPRPFQALDIPWVRRHYK